MKVQLYLYIQNMGDGSCSVKFFNSRESAEKFAEPDDERFCEDIYPKTLELDENGKLINENSRE